MQPREQRKNRAEALFSPKSTLNTKSSVDTQTFVVIYSAVDRLHIHGPKNN